MDYNALEEIENENINDLKWLYCSIILFEQKRKACNNLEKEDHYQFWKDVNQVEASYEEYVNLASKDKIVGWPTAVSITCTTKCNLFCKNCTHAKLVENKEIEQADIDLEQVCYSIRKVKFLTIINKVSDQEIVAFNFVGLGEPLMYPHIFEAYQYARKFFPKACLNINTNAVLLDDSRAKKLADSPIDKVIFSLSYFDEETYYQQTGVNCGKRVKMNICNFLNDYYNKDSKMKISIHIFDNKKNDYKSRKNYKSYFAQFVKKFKGKVFYYYYPFGNYTNDDSVSCTWDKNKRFTPVPCVGAIWRYLCIDEKGVVYPCCMGLWKLKGTDDHYLSLGNIFNDIGDINRRMIRIRQRQINKEYGSCLECETLYVPENKEYYKYLIRYTKSMESRMVRESVPDAEWLKYQRRIHRRLTARIKSVCSKIAGFISSSTMW